MTNCTKLALYLVTSALILGCIQKQHNEQKLCFNNPDSLYQHVLNEYNLKKTIVDVMDDQNANMGPFTRLLFGDLKNRPKLERMSAMADGSFPVLERANWKGFYTKIKLVDGTDTIKVFAFHKNKKDSCFKFYDIQDVDY